MKLNPITLSWLPPTKNTDGSAFGAADLAGYTIGIKVGTALVVPVISIPMGYDTTSLLFADLPLPRNEEFYVAMRTDANNGQTSDWALSADTIKLVHVPLPPSAVAVV